MPLRSDITINAAQFDPVAIPRATAELNEHLIELGKRGPRWWEVGPAKYREMRWNNQTPVPRPPTIESGVNFTIPSRDSGRELPVRMFTPEKGEPKGIMMHMHSGGFVLMSEQYQDSHLKWLADTNSVTVISIGYRLAPENPFPAGAEDCVDAAEYLLKHGLKYGGELLFLGGESAGAHLSVTTTLQLLRTHTEPLPIKGLILYFGVYDLSQYLPAAHTFDTAPVMDFTTMLHYQEALCPNTTIEQRRNPLISPFYENLNKFRGRLPPALLLCGTEDPLLDDTTMMSIKWMGAGGEAIVRIYAGAPHGFIMFPESACESAGLAKEVVKEFMHEKLGA